MGRRLGALGLQIRPLLGALGRQIRPLRRGCDILGHCGGRGLLIWDGHARASCEWSVLLSVSSNFSKSAR